jgi:hypothetical protein
MGDLYSGMVSVAFEIALSISTSRDLDIEISISPQQRLPSATYVWLVLVSLHAHFFLAVNLLRLNNHRQTHHYQLYRHDYALTEKASTYTQNSPLRVALTYGTRSSVSARLRVFRSPSSRNLPHLYITFVFVARIRSPVEV